MRRPWIQRIQGCLAAAAVVSLAMTSPAFAQKSGDKPRVPPGIDPGGVAVAIISGGLDYTRPDIAARLARDGEGQLFGWDFVDSDRLPFATCVGEAPNTPSCATTAASTIVRLAPGARLIAIRASPSRPQSLVEAMLLVKQSSARYVYVSFDEQQELVTHFLFDAATRFPGLKFYVEARNIRHPDSARPMPANLFSAEQPLELIAMAVTLLAPPPIVDRKTP